MKVNYSHELSQRIQNFLDNADLKYTFNSDIGSFWFKFHSPLSPFTYFLVHFLTENDCIQLDVTFPLSIASRHRSKIKEFISDCNYPMKNGCFHLNPRNGVLQFHIFIDSIDRIPTDKVLAHALACACTMMDFHCYKLLRLLTDTSEPEKADPLSPIPSSTQIFWIRSCIPSRCRMNRKIVPRGILLQTIHSTSSRTKRKPIALTIRPSLRRKTNSFGKIF